MRRRKIFAAAALCVGGAITSACGSNHSLADVLAPTTGATVTALTLTVDTPPVGFAVQATARATFSTGASSAVTTGFGTDTPGVATSTAGGLVTGVAIGDVTIFVDYQGMRASKKVHVLPAFGGLFSGTYVVSNCTQTDGFATANFCGQFTNGMTLTAQFLNTQSADLTNLSSQFLLGQAQGVGAGTITPDGVLSYSGALVGTTSRMDFQNFTATSPSPGRFTGAFNQVWTDSATTGSAVLTCTNLDVSRTSGAASSAIGPSVIGSSGIGFARAILRGGRVLQ